MITTCVLEFLYKIGIRLFRKMILEARHAFYNVFHLSKFDCNGSADGRATENSLTFSWTHTVSTLLEHILNISAVLGDSVGLAVTWACVRACDWPANTKIPYNPRSSVLRLTALIDSTKRTLKAVVHGNCVHPFSLSGALVIY